MAEVDALDKYLADSKKKEKKQMTIPRSAGDGRQAMLDADMISLSSYKMEAMKNSNIMAELSQKVESMAYGVNGRPD